MIKFNQILSLSIPFLVVSCANIVPNYHYQTAHKTPTQQIKQFTHTTEKNALDNLIENGKASNYHFLKPKRNKKINFWIKYYTGRGKRTLEKFLSNGEKYKPIIIDILKQHNLPEELFYVGLIESGYMNHAKSHAGAVGPWQFMPDTARRYGLKVTRSIDERKNIYKSTQAAALFFQDLYNIFGSWELALAAYNAGEYGIIRRIRGANTRDYYELSARKIIPKETRHYVPKVIASMYVSKNLEKYNVNHKKGHGKIYHRPKVIKINKATSLKTLSKQLNVSVKVIKKLNHDIHKNYIPYMGKNGFEIYLPNKTAQRKIAFLEKNSKVLESKTFTKTERPSNTNYHRVKNNESLYSISRRYNIKISTLKKINNLNSDMIYKGQKIKLLSGAKPQIKPNHIVKNIYKVKKGDNLSLIADKIGTRIATIKKLNRLKSTRLLVGQKLRVPKYKKQLYTVRPGDVLSKIARTHGTSIRRIKELNNLNQFIYPGQKLIVDIQSI